MQIKVLDGGPVIGYKAFHFSDYQPHVELGGDLKDKRVEIVVSITSVNDLFELMLIHDVLQNNHARIARLFIKYLLGARMDKRNSDNEPWTLRVVADTLNQGTWKVVDILDPHSDVALELIHGAQAVYPHDEFDRVLNEYDPNYTSIVVPDEGAKSRVLTLMKSHPEYDIVYCKKYRNPTTGRITDFEVDSDSVPKGCLIVDDICDGGATFSMCAQRLRELGSDAVDLFVTHGIFSKGIPLKGIDLIHTTDSLKDLREYRVNNPVYV